MQPSPAPVFEASSTALIRLAVEALASDPALTPAQAQVRGEAVVCGIMAFLPSDPVQTMLASQAVGQHLLVLDTFREIQVRSLSENGSLRMRLAAGTLTRTTLSLMRELRVTRATHRAAVLEERESLRARAEWEAAEAREAAEAWEAGAAASREAPAPAPAPVPPLAVQPAPPSAQSPSAQPLPIRPRVVEAAPPATIVAGGPRPEARPPEPPARAGADTPVPVWPVQNGGSHQHASDTGASRVSATGIQEPGAARMANATGPQASSHWEEPGMISRD